MADLYQYNTLTGIITPDTGEVQTQVENEYRTKFGSDLDLTPSTPQGRLIEMETLSRQGAVGLCALVANQINIDYATGQYLDAIGAFFGVDRIGATSTSVLATISGLAGTVIPAGSLAETAAGDQFYLENDSTIGANGQVQSYFLSVKTGAIPCVVGTLTKIVSQVVGWETVNNPAAATIGLEQESDFDYRRRIKNARFQGLSLLQSIKGALNQIINLKSSFVMDNSSGNPLEYQGVTLPPHSILVIADGGDDLEIATAIFNKKSSGSDYTSITNQAVTVPVVDGAYGVSYDVTFNRPQVLEVDVDIEVRRNEYTGEDLETDVKNAVLNWSTGGVENVDGLKIGQSLSPYEIGAAVSEQIPSIYVKSVKVALNGQTPSANEIFCLIYQIFDIQLANINVTVED